MKSSEPQTEDEEGNTMLEFLNPVPVIKSQLLKTICVSHNSENGGTVRTTKHHNCSGYRLNKRDVISPENEPSK